MKPENTQIIAELIFDLTVIIVASRTTWWLLLLLIVSGYTKWKQK